MIASLVALRKESVDRNQGIVGRGCCLCGVALRKESVDRNHFPGADLVGDTKVALRKESVDRNIGASYGRTAKIVSLSARRAWIEIRNGRDTTRLFSCRSPQGERG